VNTITLSKQNLIDWMTANGSEDISDDDLENEIERYRVTLESELGEGYEVEVSAQALDMLINGMPTSCADDDVRYRVFDTEAYVAERFW
jgi:hypothetical protein